MIKLMRNQKGFAPILVLVGILIIGALAYGISYLVNTKSQIKQPLINNGVSETTQNTFQNNQANIDSAKVFYIDSSFKKIYMLDGINATAQSIIDLPTHEDGSVWDANILGLSLDKKWLFYYATNKDASILGAYDVTNKTEKVISKIEQSPTKPNRIRYEILWSPNGKYVIFSHYNNYGNSASDNISEVYSYPNFEKITSFYSYNTGDQYYGPGDSSIFPLSTNTPRIVFLDDENITYLDPINKTGFLDLDVTLDKMQSQISLFNTKAKKTKVLVNYQEGLILGLIQAKDNMLYYFTDNHNDSLNPIYKFYSVDKNANTSEANLDLLKQLSPNTSATEVNTFKTMKRNLPSPYSSDDYYIRSGPLQYNQTHWIIIEIDKNSDNPLKPIIAILNQDDPKNTFKVIGQGFDPIL